MSTLEINQKKKTYTFVASALIEVKIPPALVQSRVIPPLGGGSALLKKAFEVAPEAPFDSALCDSGASEFKVEAVETTTVPTRLSSLP